MDASKYAAIPQFRRTGDNILQLMTYSATRLKLDDTKYGSIQPFQRS